MAADRQHAPQYTPAPDPYEWSRCPRCQHLVYPTDQPGECQWCSCTDHDAPGRCLCSHPVHGDERCSNPACGCRTSNREAAA